MADVDLRFLAAQNERILTRMNGLVAKIDALESKIDALVDDMRVLTGLTMIVQ